MAAIDDDGTHGHPHRQPATMLAQGLGTLASNQGAVVVGWQPATTFKRDALEPDRPVYIRDQGPSLAAAESMLSTLEGGAGAMLYSSGMAAATAPFLALQPGQTVLFPDMCYWTLRNFVHEQADHVGLRLITYRSGDLTDLAAKIPSSGADLIWVETPANPTWVLTDIAAVAGLARPAGARVVVDSTCAAPLLTQPLAHGADLVMHSATKVLNGHGDVLAGALVTAQDDEAWVGLKRQRAHHGNQLGAFEGWLLTRGMRTLSVRLQRMCANAMSLAGQLSAHPAVEAVLYPGLDVDQALVARQMRGIGGYMLSFLVKGGATVAHAVPQHCQLIHNATSLGGVESLIEHRKAVEGDTSPCPDALVRMSVGIEDLGDLWADLDQALSRAARG